MSRNDLLSAIDSEIATLQQVRALLLDESSIGSRRSRTPTKKRKLSAEARAKIAAAQKRRWAKQKTAKKAG